MVCSSVYSKHEFVDVYFWLKVLSVYLIYLLFISYIFIYLFVFVCLLFYDVVTGTLLTETLAFFCPYFLPIAVSLTHSS